LGLTQREAATLIGVVRDALARWESAGKEPDLRVLPAVIGFLGYDPRPEPANFVQILVYVRGALGLSQSEFGRKVSVPTPTLRAWEQGLCTPSEKRQRLVEIGMRSLLQVPKSPLFLPRN
jgi:DNA-binding transcriptional regulator YiaG